MNENHNDLNGSPTITPIDWANLTEGARNLVPTDEIRVDRNLTGIAKEAQRLASRQIPHVSSSQIRDFAHQAGIDLQQHSAVMSSVDVSTFQEQARPSGPRGGDITMTSATPGGVPTDRRGGRGGRGAQQRGTLPDRLQPSSMDVRSFLRHHHEYIISSTIQECQILSARHFRRKYIKSMEDEWENTKEDILNYLGVERGGANATRPPPSLNNTTYREQGLGGLTHQLTLTPSLADYGRRDAGTGDDPEGDDEDEDMENGGMFQRDNATDPSSMFQNRTANAPASPPLLPNKDWGRMRRKNRDNKFKRLTQWEQQFAEVMMSLVASRKPASAVTAPVLPFTTFAHISDRQTRLAKADAERNQTKFTADQKDSHKSLISLWDCASWMAHEKDDMSEHYQRNLDIEEFQFFAAHYDDTLKKGLERLLIYAAIGSMQSQMKEFMIEQVKEYPDLAQIGGRLGDHALVMAYVRLTCAREPGFEKLDQIQVGNNRETLPLWPLIYYSFRIGNFDLAIHFCGKNQTDCIRLQHALESLKEQLEAIYTNETPTGRQPVSIPNVIQRFANNPPTLPNQRWSHLEVVWKNSVLKESLDAFEIVMNLAVGKFAATSANTQRVAQLVGTAEDHLWLHLWMCSDTVENAPAWLKSDPTDPYSSKSLNDIQDQVRQVNDQASANMKPFLFPRLLLLTQQFELAVKWLWEAKRHLECIHLGSVLRYYGLLQLANDTYIQSGGAINLSKYVKFWASHLVSFPKIAFTYLAILEDKHLESFTKRLHLLQADGNVEEPERTRLYLQNNPITDVMIQHLADSGPNSELTKIWVGFIRGSNIKVEGLVKSYFGEIQCRMICTAAANRAKQNGEDETAIELCLLAGDYNEAGQQLITALGGCLDVKRSDPRKTHIMNLADCLYRVNMQPNVSHDFRDVRCMSDSIAASLSVAIFLGEFYEHFKNGTDSYNYAMKAIEKADILPLKANQNQNDFTPLRNKIRDLHSDVQKHIADICYSVMKILAYKLDTVKSRVDIGSIAVNDEKFEICKSLSEQCYTLYNFYGRIVKNLVMSSSRTDSEMQRLTRYTRLNTV